MSNIRRFFNGGRRTEVLNTLTDTITAGKGMVMLTGVKGTGKNTLCKMILEKLPGSFETVHLSNGGLGPVALVSAIAGALGLPVSADTPGKSLKNQLVSYLLQAHRQERRLVVIIEEAHRMPVDSLLELGQLGDLTDGGLRLLYPVLIGQPGLEKLIVNKNINGSFAHSVNGFSVSPLNCAETREYVRSQLRNSGHCGADLFTFPAFHQLYRSSMGHFRLLNRLADHAMLAAYAEGCNRVHWRHVYRSANSLRERPPEHLKESLAGGLIACGLLAGVFLQLPSPHLGVTDKPETAADQHVSQNIDEIRRIALTMKPAAGLPLVSSRMEASRDWFRQVATGGLTIQLMQSDGDLVELEQLLASDDYANLLNDIYLYRSTLDGRTHWHVLYGRFTNKTKALAALAALPDKVRLRQTGLRSLGAFRLSGPLADTETYLQGQG